MQELIPSRVSQAISLPNHRGQRLACLSHNHAVADFPAPIATGRGHRGLLYVFCAVGHGPCGAGHPAVRTNQQRQQRVQYLCQFNAVCGLEY